MDEYPARQLPAAIKMRRLFCEIEILQEEVHRLKVAAGEVPPYEGFWGTEMHTVFRLINERAAGRAAINVEDAL